MFLRVIIKPVMLLLAAILLHTPSVRAASEQCEVWPAWNGFRQKFISDDGRVVDRSLPQHITTSEGQSYALMFALIANDRSMFERILRWTEDNLANGDLTGQLPAWLWGQREDSSWGVIDGNAASDADLWIAYTLEEAGQLWSVPRYSALAELLAARILREETAELPGLGLALLPGPKGFRLNDNTWRLNPSYLPMQIMRRFEKRYPKTGWDKLARTSLAILTESAPLGYAPEWIDYQAGTGFLTAHGLTQAQAVGYNAIRVYLWAGMLDRGDPAQPVLLRKLSPMGQHIDKKGTIKEAASAGFSSAMLPFLKVSRLNRAMQQQRQRLIVLAPLARDDNYYDQVLTLFGQGWMDGLYRFDRNGQLKPRWKCTKD